MKSAARRAARRSAAKPRTRASTQRSARTVRAPEANGAALPPGVYLSINEAAAEFGNDRRTLTKRIADLGIRPAGTRQGYAVYRLRDLLEIERRSADGETDPDKLDPFDRRAHYQAEFEKLRVNRERGVLIPREAYERELARVLKVVSLDLDTLVDKIERDVGASPLMLEMIEREIDAIRERIYLDIVEPDEEDRVPSQDGADESGTVP